MGLTTVDVGDGYTARAKDTLAIGSQWALWVTLSRGDEDVAWGQVMADDLEDATIRAAVHGFKAGVVDNEAEAA